MWTYIRICKFCKTSSKYMCMVTVTVDRMKLFCRMKGERKTVPICNFVTIPGFDMGNIFKATKLFMYGTRREPHLASYSVRVQFFISLSLATLCHMIKQYHPFEIYSYIIICHLKKIVNKKKILTLLRYSCNELEP